MKPVWWFVLITALLAGAGCAPRLPQEVKDVAIAAVCDMPPPSGKNMCQSIRIARVLEEPVIGTLEGVKPKTKSWCLEMNYVDFTGDTGNVIVRVAGPMARGDYIVSDGPYYDRACDQPVYP